MFMVRLSRRKNCLFEGLDTKIDKKTVYKQRSTQIDKAKIAKVAKEHPGSVMRRI